MLEALFQQILEYIWNILLTNHKGIYFDDSLVLIRQQGITRPNNFQISIMPYARFKFTD